MRLPQVNTSYKIDWQSSKYLFTKMDAVFVLKLISRRDWNSSMESLQFQSLSGSVKKRIMMLIQLTFNLILYILFSWHSRTNCFLVGYRLFFLVTCLSISWLDSLVLLFHCFPVSCLHCRILPIFRNAETHSSGIVQNQDVFLQNRVENVRIISDNFWYPSLQLLNLLLPLR